MDIKQMSALELAFVGDAVFELAVRSHIARSVNTDPNTLHRMAVSYVRAAAQRELLDEIKEDLSEEEQNIVRRGRNSSKITTPKNATPADYRAATALEALFGYLYLSGRTARIDELMERAFALTPRQ